MAAGEGEAGRVVCRGAGERGQAFGGGHLGEGDGGLGGGGEGVVVEEGEEGA